MALPGKYLTHILAPLLIIFIQPAYASNKQQSIAFNGKLNLENQSWSENETINLDGNWQFHWNQLLSPEEIQGFSGDVSYFQLPRLWSNADLTREAYSSSGYATFSLQVRGQFRNKKMALETPSMYCSYRLWVNGQEVAKNGTVADNKIESKPYWKPLVGLFNSKSDTLHIVLQISNFHHSKGGMSESIILASEETVLKRMKERRGANLIHVIGIGILSILTLLAYLIYWKNYVLWFSIFSMMWSLRGIFSNMYLIQEWIPDFSWLIGTKIEYLTLYFSLLIGIHIFHRLYSKFTYPIVNKISLIVNSGFILITIVSPVSFFSTLLLPFFIFMGLLLIYALISIINALIHSEKGSLSLTIGVIIVIILFFYDLLSYQNIVSGNPYILNIGYLLIYYLLGFSLVYHVVTNSKNKSPERPTS